MHSTVGRLFLPPDNETGSNIYCVNVFYETPNYLDVFSQHIQYKQAERKHITDKENEAKSKLNNWL